VRDMEGELEKTVLLSNLDTAREWTREICRRFLIAQSDEFALQLEGTSTTWHCEWLDQNIRFCDQASIPNADEVHTVVMRKRFFVFDGEFQLADTAYIHFLFLECKQSVLRGVYPLSMEEALAFAALQLQITVGNYDPLVHVSGFLNVKEFLPSQWHSLPFIEEDMIRLHRTIKDLSTEEAKFRYIRKLQRIKSFGVNYVLALEKLEGSAVFDHDILVGVAYDSLLCLHPDTKSVLCRHYFALVQLEVDHAKQILTWGMNRSRSFHIPSASDLAMFVDMYRGYVELQTRSGSPMIYPRSANISRSSSLASLAEFRLQKSLSMDMRQLTLPFLAVATEDVIVRSDEFEEVESSDSE